MTEIAAYLNAHPVLWALLAVLVAVTVLRIVVKLACLAVLIVVGLSVAGAVLGIAGRIF